MSANQFPKISPANESNIPVPKRINTATKKSKRCAQLPELQKYIETIIKASNECDPEDSSQSKKDKFLKERKFGSYSFYKARENNVKQEKNKNQLNWSGNKNNVKAKTSLSDAVSRSVRVYNTYAPEFEDPRNWKAGKTQSLGPSVEIEKFLKKFYPNPYQIESIKEFKQPENDSKDELRDGTLPDVVISKANIHTDVDIEKTDNDFQTADTKSCMREKKSLNLTETQSTHQHQNKISDAKSAEGRCISVPGLSTKPSRVKSSGGKSNASSRASSAESMKETLSRESLRKRKTIKPKSRSKPVKKDSLSDYDIGKLKLLSVSDSEQSISMTCIQKHGADVRDVELNSELCEEIYKAEDFNDLKEIYDIMYKATESFFQISNKNESLEYSKNLMESSLFSRNIDTKSELNNPKSNETLINSSRTKLELSNSNKTEDEIYKTIEDKFDERTITDFEIRFDEREPTEVEKSLIDVLLKEDEFKYRHNPGDRKPEQVHETVSNYEVDLLEETSRVDTPKDKSDFSNTNEKPDEILDFMYGCLKNLNNKENPSPGDDKKFLPENEKSNSCKKLRKESVTNINYEKPTTSGSLRPVNFPWMRQDSTENLLTKTFPDIKEIKSKYSAALGEINRKTSRGRCKKRPTLNVCGSSSNYQIPLSEIPTPENPITEFPLYQHSAEEIIETGASTAIQTVESQNELGGFTEEPHEGVIFSDENRIPKPLCPLSVKQNIKINTGKKLKDVLEAEEKLLTSEKNGKESEEKLLAGEKNGKEAEEKLLKSEKNGKEAEEKLLKSEKNGKEAEEKLLKSEKNGKEAEEKLLTSEKNGKEAKEKLLTREKNAKEAEEKPKDVPVSGTQEVQECQAEGQTDTTKVFSHLAGFQRPSSSFVCLNSLPRNLRNTTSVGPSLPIPASASLNDIKRNWGLSQTVFASKIPLKKHSLTLEEICCVLEHTYSIKQEVLLTMNKSVVAYTARPVSLKIITHFSKPVEELSLRSSECLVTMNAPPMQEFLPEEEGTPAFQMTQVVSTVDDKPVQDLIEAIEETEEKLYLLEQSSGENLYSRNSEMCSLSMSETLKNEFSESEVEKVNDRQKVHDLLLRTYTLQQKLYRYLQKMSCDQSTTSSCPLVQQEDFLDFGMGNSAKIELDIKSERSLPVVHWHMKSPEIDVVARTDESVTVNVSMVDDSTSYEPPTEEKSDKGDQPKQEKFGKENDEQFLQDTADDEDDQSSNYSFKSSNDYSEQSEAKPRKEYKDLDYMDNKKLFQKIYSEIESFRQSFEAEKLEKQQQHQGEPIAKNQEDPVDKRVAQYDPKTPAKVLRTVFTGKKSSTELTIGLKDVPMTKVGNISVEKTKFSPNHTKISVAFTKESTGENNKLSSYLFDQMISSLSTCVTECSGKDNISKSSQSLNGESDDDEDEDDYKSVASNLGNSDLEADEQKPEPKEQKPVETSTSKTYTKHRFDFYRRMVPDVDTIKTKPKSLSSPVCKYKELEPLKQALTDMQIRMRNIKREALFNSNDYYERALKLAKMSAGFCQSCGNRAVIPNDTFGYYRTLLPRRSTHHRRSRHFRPTLTQSPSFYSLHSGNVEIGDQFCELGMKHSSYILNPRFHSNQTVLRNSLHDMPILFERI